MCNFSMCTPLKSCILMYVGRTLRHRAGQFGHAVGNFFGLTEESQRGNANRIGWEEFTERRAVEVWTMSSI